VAGWKDATALSCDIGVEIGAAAGNVVELVVLL
jgi:hypothetical protein